MRFLTIQARPVRLAEWLGGLGVALGGVGCATGGADQTMSLSMETLASEGVNRADGPLAYRSAVTLTGIAPPISAGRLLSVPGEGMPEQLSIPITTGCSKLVETLYDSDATATDVRAIATGLEQLRDKLTVKAEKEVTGELARVAKSMVELAGDKGAPRNEDAISLQNTLGLKTFDKDSIEQVKAQLDAQVAALSADAARLTRELIQLRDRKNLFIFRWQRNGAMEGGGLFGTLFSVRGAQKDARQGYLIAANLRVAAIEFGDDLMLKLVRDAESGKTGSDAVLPNNFLTNYTVGAKHTYFSEDRDAASAIAAALKMSPADVQQLFGGSARQILEAKSIAIDAAISASVASGARGMVIQPTRKTYPFRMWGDTAFAASGNAERARNEHYNVFYSTRTNVAELKVPPGAGPQGKAAFYCMQMVPEQGKISSLKLPASDTRFCSPRIVGADGWRALSKSNPSDWEPEPSACIDFAATGAGR
ncbi:hypothetical protein [Hydrogenophaga sp.]|uniref:hypothetical protein n=1 Tax=Hydrogenophaga sp. TaxID=1904254 RepID=UPI002FC75169